jgi:hypothetical protein
VKNLINIRENYIVRLFYLLQFIVSDIYIKYGKKAAKYRKSNNMCSKNGENFWVEN